MAMDLGKQVGPMPMGAWIAVVGGGLGIAWWARRNQSGTTTVQDTSGTPGVGEGPGWVAVPPPSTAPGGNGPVVYNTNEDWGRAAITWLSGRGFDAGMASSAITKALQGGIGSDGSSITITEWSLWTMAIAALGPPPIPVNVSPPSGLPGPVVPVPPPPSTPPQPTPPAPPPAANPAPVGKWYTVVKGDNLWNLSRRFSGSGTNWPWIWFANMISTKRPDGSMGQIVSPNLIYPGERLWIPWA